MVRHTIEVFSDAEYIVLPSGSCAGMLRCFYPELAGTEGEELAARTFELSQFLVQVLHGRLQIRGQSLPNLSA